MIPYQVVGWQSSSTDPHCPPAQNVLLSSYALVHRRSTECQLCEDNGEQAQAKNRGV